jgi:hypothetical protein
MLMLWAEDGLTVGEISNPHCLPPCSSAWKPRACSVTRKAWATATKSSRGNVDVRLHVTRLTRTARHLRVVSQVPAVRQASDGLKQHLT